MHIKQELKQANHCLSLCRDLLLRIIITISQDKFMEGIYLESSHIRLDACRLKTRFKTRPKTRFKTGLKTGIKTRFNTRPKTRFKTGLKTGLKTRPKAPFIKCRIVNRNNFYRRAL